MDITSTANQRVKDVVKLRDRRHRDETGLTVIDGAREISRAVCTGVELVTVFFCAEFLKEEEARQVKETLANGKAELIEVAPPVFEKLAFGERREGLLAVARPRSSTWAVLDKKDRPFVVVLEGVEKPGNLGAVLRSCDGAGVDALVIGGAGTDVFNPNVIRASLGTVFAVPVIQSAEGEALEFFRKRNIRVVATTPSASRCYDEEDLSLPLAVVLGNEQEGLKNFWLEKCDARIKLPMQGQADSLNVSNTAAILVYEVLRRKRQA